MTRVAAVVAALAAVLIAAPASLAATFTVNDPTAAADAGAIAACTAQPSTAGCTLPAAITASDTTPATVDTIDFSVSPGPFTTGQLPPVMQPALIDGGGSATITFDPTATGSLLDIQASNTTVKTLALTGGNGTLVNLAGSGDRLDTVTARDTAGTGVRIGASGVRIDGSRVQNTGAGGINVAGANATIASPVIAGTQGNGITIASGGAGVSSPDITGASGDGINIPSDGASVSGGRIHGNSGAGVAIGGQNDSVTEVVFYGNGGKPILRPNVISPPENLRIGPRRADGTLPLTGTSSSATIDLWSGDPSSATPPSLVTTFSASGDFTYNFPTEPQPGAVFALSQTAGGLGSSEFATVAVPSDVDSPVATFARALDTLTVRVDFTEPLDPASVQPQDFKLTMAGAERQITSAAASPDGRFVTLSSSGWKAGEAGYVDIAGPGAVTDAAGNALLQPGRLRVAAAPGDFVAPLGAKLAVTPKTICLTRGRNCRKPGLTIKFTASEPGKARMLIKRSNKTVGSRLYGNIVAGANTLKFNGRLGSRKLRAGRYRLLMYVQDVVGNVTDQPPIVLFSVRRVTK